MFFSHIKDLIRRLEEENEYLRRLLAESQERERRAVDALLAIQQKPPLQTPTGKEVGAILDEYVALFKDRDGGVDPDKVVSTSS